MDDTRVAWEGEFSPGDLAGLVEASSAERGRTLSTRLEAVNDRIDHERESVVEVAPAQLVYEQLRERVIPGPGDEAAAAAARTFVALALLDAVEGIFDRPALSERLNQTVF